MSGNIVPYTDLVTTEHQEAARFLATVGATAQPFADEQDVLGDLPADFDIDLAVGAQLDVAGLWVGLTRVVGVYTLTDEPFRRLIRARALRNRWDGSIPGAYAIYDVLFEGQFQYLLIIDYQDMSMDIAITGAAPDPATVAILTGGYLSVRPGGVMVNRYAYPTAPGGPLFGFGFQTPYIAGFGTGVWAAFA